MQGTESSLDSKSLIIGLIIGVMLGASSIYIFYISKIRKIEESYEILNENHIQLCETLDLYELNDSYIDIPLNITVPNVNENETRKLQFSVGYGILLQVYIGVYTLEDNYLIEEEVSWRRGDEGANLGGGGIHYKKLPKYITGVAYCEIQFETEESICFNAGTKMNPPIKWSVERLAKFHKNPP